MGHFFIIIKMDTHFVYIIQSEKDGSYYKGYSLDPLLRLSFHNLGKSNYTSKKIPWKLVAIFSFSTKSEALIREKKIVDIHHFQKVDFFYYLDK
jgi:putative endonuclease